MQAVGLSFASNSWVRYHTADLVHLGTWCWFFTCRPIQSQHLIKRFLPRDQPNADQVCSGIIQCVLVHGQILDAWSDRIDGSLEALKVAFGPKSNDTATIRTTIQLKQQRLFIAIKLSLGKTMAPNCAAATAWTGLRLFPWKIALLIEKFLEWVWQQKRLPFVFRSLWAGQAHFVGKDGSMPLSIRRPCSLN